MKVRFWGKLFGTKKNYYVAEVEWAKDAMLEKVGGWVGGWMSGLLGEWVSGWVKKWVSGWLGG